MEPASAAPPVQGSAVLPPPLRTQGTRGAALPPCGGAPAGAGAGAAAPTRPRFRFRSRPNPGSQRVQGLPRSARPPGGPAPPRRLCLAAGQNKAERRKGEGRESAAPASSRPSAWISLHKTALQADPDRGQGVERGGGGGRRGREGRRDEREPLSFPGLFFQFPVSHCAHSGYVLRLQVCPLLTAFPRLPSVGTAVGGGGGSRPSCDN